MKTSQKYQTLPISLIKARYNSGEGRHWFDRSTLRFFRSIIPRTAYQGEGGTFFVTSEQFVGPNGVADARRYTVRQFLGEGNIQTVGPFNELEKSEAIFRAKQFAIGNFKRA